MAGIAFVPYFGLMALLSKIDQNGRVVLPAEVRKALGLDTGDRLVVAVEDGAIVLRSFATTARTARARVREALGDDVKGLSKDLLALRRGGLWRE